MNKNPKQREEWIYFVDRSLPKTSLLQALAQKGKTAKHHDELFPPDAMAALASMRRALKPGGILLFCEQGVAPDPSTAKWQGRITPLWRKIAGGCHLNRPIPALLEQGGFRIIWMETMYLPSTPKIVGFNYWGAAEIA